MYCSAYFHSRMGLLFILCLFAHEEEENMFLVNVANFRRGKLSSLQGLTKHKKELPSDFNSYGSAAAVVTSYKAENTC